MGDTYTLATISGLTARVVRLFVGIPLLTIGGLLVSAGLGDSGELVNVILLGLGTVLGFAGV